jgi:hypothetical protein
MADTERSVLLPLRYVYPECSKLIEPHPQMYPLKCLRNDGCPANVGCMGILVQRVDYLFSEVMPEAEMLIAYFTYGDTKSLRGAVFYRDLREPRLITMNPSGFRRLQTIGTVGTWVPTDTYKNIQTYQKIIPADRLIRN